MIDRKTYPLLSDTLHGSVWAVTSSKMADLRSFVEQAPRSYDAVNGVLSNPAPEIPYDGSKQLKTQFN